MPLSFDPFRGFQAGQQLQAGQNTFATFAQGLTERAKKMQELAATQAYKSQGELVVEQEKARLAEERGAKAAERFRGLLGGGGGSGGGGGFPVGSTVSYNPTTGEASYNLQLNPNLTQEESTILAITPEIRTEIDALKQLVPKVGTLGRLGSKLPFLVSGVAGEAAGAAPQDLAEVQELRTRMLRLTGTIPFTFGGKQLTIQERKVITDMLETVGKDDTLIVQDLERFGRIFEHMSNAIRNGTVGANDDLAKAQLARQLLAREGLSAGGISGTPPASLPVGEASRPAQTGDLQALAQQELRRRRGQ